MRRTMLAVTVTASLLTSGGSLGAAEQLWSLLARLWSASTSVDAGCVGDPYGACRPAPAPQTDAGCGFDPYGGCRPASSPQTDAGCEWDPYGACRPGPAPQTDEGCVWDPYGSPCHPGS